MVMFIFSLVVAGTFYVVFYILPYSDNTQEAQEKRKKLIEKETVQNEVKKVENKPAEKHHGFWCVFKVVLSKKSTRALFNVYMISKALHKAIYGFKNIFFLKSAELGGLGFTKE